MLTRSGCQMRGDVCFFEGENLHIVHSSKDISGSYRFTIDIYWEGTNDTRARCGFSLRSGYESMIVCSKEPCIQLRQ